MSASLLALQEQAQAGADAFCRRYIQPPRHKSRSKSGSTRSRHGNPSSHRTSSSSSKFYRPRDHEASPFFKVVREHFDEFEKVYPEKYQERYGYWRPVIRSSIDKFLKCGDLKEGFARVRCSRSGMSEPDTPYRRRCRMTWAALIKAVYEVDPLKCPKCGGTMKIVGFIEEENVIEKILRHCKIWKDAPPRPPPLKSIESTATMVAEPQLDYGFFTQNCI